MPTEHGFTPNWVSPPGETIAELLHDRHQSESDLARELGLTLHAAKQLLSGRIRITLGLARLLRDHLGGTVEFWMARDHQYYEDLKRLSDRHSDWLAQIPINDMTHFGWLPATSQPADRYSACLRFFNVSSVQVWHSAYSNVERITAFRTSPSYTSTPGSVAAWLRKGEIEAEQVECAPWSPARFQETLATIRTLTRDKYSDSFLPKLREICATCGVAVAIVRAPSGCRASGATRFLSEDKALLLLSFRYQSDDQFWFSFFHEAAHLLIHSNKELFLEGLGSITEELEEQANDFAANVLIPPEHKNRFHQLRPSYRQVIKFARDIGISPGIVVGQMQHYGKIDRSYLNRVKRWYKWD